MIGVAPLVKPGSNGTGGNARQDAEPPTEPDPDEDFDIEGLIKLAGLLESRSEKFRALVDELHIALFRLEKASKRRRAPPLARRRRLVPTKPQGPAPTLKEFHAEVLGDGSSTVHFDDAKQITLTPSLMELAVILAADDGTPEDELVAFKGFDRIGALLEKRLGRKFNHHTVSQLVWRLRESLSAAKLSRGLVESVPERGVRLRVKRGDSAAP